MSDSEPDWALVELMNYASAALNRTKWFETANEQLAAAAALEPFVLAWWQSLRLWKKEIVIPREHGFAWIYLMLSAYGVECLCKGALIGQMTPKRVDRLRVTGEFPKHLKTHDLVRLFRAIKLEVTLAEEELLRRLQRAAEWAARYPVARKVEGSNEEQLSDGGTYSTSWLGASDVYRVRDLVTRLRAHVDAPLTFRTVERERLMIRRSE